MASLRRHGFHPAVHGRSPERNDRHSMESRSVGSCLMPEHRQHVGVVWRALFVIVLMITAGCATRRPDFVTQVRPDFMTRVRQDCSAGEQWACDLVDALNRPPSVGRRMTEELSAAITASGIRQSNPVLLEIVSEPTYEAQLAKLAEIVARQAAGRRIPTPAERWNTTVRAFERLTEDHKMLFCARLIEAGYSPEDSE